MDTLTDTLNELDLFEDIDLAIYEEYEDTGYVPSENEPVKTQLDLIEDEDTEYVPSEYSL